MSPKACSLKKSCALGVHFPKFLLSSDMQGLTLDAITTCAFGFDTDVMNTDDTPFLDQCKAIFEHADTSNYKLKLMFVLTGLEPLPIVPTSQRRNALQMSNVPV